MTYRKHTRLNRTEFIRLNDDGSMTNISFEKKQNKIFRYTLQKSLIGADWDYAYNAYSHINAREFNDAYNLVKENL